MRFRVVSALLAAGLVPAWGQSSPEEKTYAFTLHPFASLMVTGINVSLEGKMKGLWSFEVPAYLGYNDFFSNSSLFMAGSGFGARRYLLEPGRGAFVSPQLEVINMHFSASEPGERASANVLLFIPSLRWGYKFRWEMFVLELGMGAQFVKALLTAGSSVDVDNDIDASAALLTPMFNLALGIPF